VGVATQDPELRSRFRGKPEHLINYFTFLSREAREIMASLGVRTFNELIGRTDLLKARKVDHWKARTVDPSAILHRPESAAKNIAYCVKDQVHKIEKVIDRTLIEKARPALEGKRDVNVYIDMPIANTDRATGAMLSCEISKRYGDNGLAEDTINCTFRGSAGQSFGAFLTRGVTFRLEGDANDYFGKGLSGGKLVVVPPQDSTFTPEENIIIGNTVLYGATGGEAYIRGMAGERFCVRNSGALAVIEGTGDHCAEYMTGGRIIVLGNVGRNFAAGMSGGIAYVLDMNGNFDYFCNKGMVELTPVRDYDDQDFIIEMLRKHYKYTGSTVAMTIINNWFQYVPKFIKVLPFEYKRALQEVMIEQIDRKLQMIRQEEQLGEIN
jgi:glutamate synthase (NADPH/NADH) large chain